MNTVVVTGSTGLVGREVVRAATARGHRVVGLSRTESAPTDLTDAAAVARLVADAAPDLIVHAGAWADVDGCELDPQRARAVNVDGTRNVVAAADAIDAHVVLLSTDLVFDGTKAGPYDEADPTHPISVYGATKLEAEHEVGTRHTVVRTSWVCGDPGTDMVHTVLALARTDRPLRFVTDQVGRPTFTDDLAPVILDLGADRVGGIWHVTNQGALSWFELAREVLLAAGLDPDRVEPITTAELDPPRPARRPANSMLDDAALRAAGRPRLPHFRPSLTRLVAHLTR